jgi:CRISPR-associated protein Cst2
MMWSISISYRLGLGFHALNNEGSDGSNLMQPRRIDVGKVTYDGISGEMARRHVLENFVRVCLDEKIDLLPASEALHPDRGPLALRQVAKTYLRAETLTKENIFRAARKAVEKCALVDVGGFLAAFSKEASSGGIPESGLENAIASVGTDQNRPYTVKRDSVFDVGWLISEEPQEMTVTQHAAYRPTGEQSLFSQTMRSNVYAGVMRADLHRIGTDDYWYLRTEDSTAMSRTAIAPLELKRRQKALVKAVIDYVASPTGAKTAGWAPHVFKTEGVILLTSARTAPFASPIKLDLENAERPIQPNSNYSSQVLDLGNETDTWAWPFASVKDLLEVNKKVIGILDGENAKDQRKDAQEQ